MTRVPIYIYGFLLLALEKSTLIFRHLRITFLSHLLLSKLTKGTFNIFPNPSTGAFTPSFNDGQGKYLLSVYDILGREILSKPVNFDENKDTKLEIKQPGIYVVTLQNSKQRINQKIIVE
jgi:hypothetical protein